MNTTIIDETNFVQKISALKNPFFEGYYAFYSSWLGGITTNPHMMLLPIDDHMVHRGDGVFEAIKVVRGSVYLIEEHLKRLFDSASKISLNLPFDVEHVRQRIIETLRVANQENVIIRIFVSRGPGDFSVNPYDSIAAQLYIVVTKLKPPSAEKYLNGVAIGKSTIPIKVASMAQIKSCNYLPNVLMKKEAVDRGLDFVIGVDSEELIAEGPTENIMIVDQNENIIHPPFTHILKGTMMLRVFELAGQNGFKTVVQPISFENLQSAREVMMTGTTLDVLPVVRFENTPIGDGRPGLIAKKLNELIQSDIKAGNRGMSF